MLVTWKVYTLFGIWEYVKQFKFYRTTSNMTTLMPYDPLEHTNMFSKAGPYLINILVDVDLKTILYIYISESMFN